MVAWVATIVTVVTLSASKRPVYLLPIFPAVALLVADGLTATPSPRLTRLLRATTALYAPVLALVALVLLAVVAGVDVAAPFASVLAPEDRASVRRHRATSCAAAGRDRRWRWWCRGSRRHRARTRRGRWPGCPARRRRIAVWGSPSSSRSVPPWAEPRGSRPSCRPSPRSYRPASRSTRICRSTRACASTRPVP